MKLDLIADKAERFAQLYLNDDRKDKPEVKKLVLEVSSFSPMEMAYFCQQFVSHMPKVHQASLGLTVFTNLLIKLEVH